MKEIDPGHEYLLDSFDGGDPVRLTFVKREGEGYPFNVGHHPGTNCQEVIRALIARVKYIQKQIPCDENERVITELRSCLWAFESRAAKRHGRASVLPWQEQYQTVPIEEQPTCVGCGHVGCNGEGHRANASKTTAPSPSVREAAEAVDRWTRRAYPFGSGMTEEARLSKLAEILSRHIPLAIAEDKDDLISRSALLEELKNSHATCIKNAEQDKRQPMRVMMEHFAEAGRQIIERIKNFPAVSTAGGDEDDRPSCWHCGVVLAYAPKLRCEDCPDECDKEGCDEIGCAADSVGEEGK